MDTTPLTTWLGLPPGDWPPAPHALLGLPPGEADPAAAERHALARMEVLRPHQLLHPELVTEGMNRLAQALIAVTAAPPPKPKRKKPKPAPEPVPTAAPAGAVPFPAVELTPDPPAARVVEWQPGERPPKVQVYDAEVILDAVPVAPAVAPPAAETVPDAGTATVELPPLPEPEPPPGLAYTPRDRRAGYRRLVFLRHLLAAWDKFRPTLADPGQSLPTAYEVYLFLDAVDGVRGVRGGDTDFLTDEEYALLAICRHPTPLALVRELTADQRQTLAKAWATGRAEIRRQSLALRLGMRHARRRSRGLAVAGRRRLARHPEWVLVLLTALLGLTALARTIGR